MTKVIGIGKFFRTERQLARGEQVSNQDKIRNLDFISARPFSADALIIISRLLERPKILLRKLIRLSF